MSFGYKKLPGPSRAYTEEEVRKMFLDQVCNMISYWNGEGNSNVDPNRPSREKMEGLVHSLLVMFDGGTGGMPALDIVCRPHPDDAEYCKKEGEDWFPDGLVINNCQLHDEYNARGRK